MRPSQGDVREDTERGESSRPARILRRKGQKEEGRKGVFLGKPNGFEAVDENRKKRACVCVRTYVCALSYICVCMCQLCVDARKAERVSLEKR